MFCHPARYLSSLSATTRLAIIVGQRLHRFTTIHIVAGVLTVRAAWLVYAVSLPSLSLPPFVLPRPFDRRKQRGPRRARAIQEETIGRDETSIERIGEGTVAAPRIHYDWSMTNMRALVFICWIFVCRPILAAALVYAESRQVSSLISLVAHCLLVGRRNFAARLLRHWAGNDLATHASEK